MKKLYQKYTAPLLVQLQQYDFTIGHFLAYSYANNNPISFKDPSGLEPEGEKGRDEVQAQTTWTDVWGTYAENCLAEEILAEFEQARTMDIENGKINACEYIQETINLTYYRGYGGSGSSSAGRTANMGSDSDNGINAEENDKKEQLPEEARVKDADKLDINQKDESDCGIAVLAAVIYYLVGDIWGFENINQAYEVISIQLKGETKKIGIKKVISILDCFDVGYEKVKKSDNQLLENEMEKIQNAIINSQLVIGGMSNKKSILEYKNFNEYDDDNTGHGIIYRSYRNSSNPYFYIMDPYLGSNRNIISSYEGFWDEHNYKYLIYTWSKK